MPRESVVERVNKESKYQRAVAKWISLQTNEDVSKIYGADFWMEFKEGCGCPTCGPEEYCGLEYCYNGRWKGLDLRYRWTPGQFLEECVKILGEG